MRFLIVACLLCAVSGSAANELDLQQMLDSATNKQTPKITLPAGRWKINGRLALNRADGLTIEGKDTTLVFSDSQGSGWSFNDCKKIVLRGFTIDYDPLPFIQARITKRSNDGKIYDFTVSKGYPGLRREDENKYRQGYVFEPKRHRWKAWAPDIYSQKVEILDERHGRFIMGYVPPGHEHIEAGDRFVMTLRSGGAIRMNNCEDIRIEDLTFHAAPGAAYIGRYMRGDNYFRYTIEPGKMPAGATEPRLISTCADGLNIAFATKGPTIDRCKFSFMGDDSVNLHGAVFAVVGTPSDREILAVWPYGAEQLSTVVLKGMEVRHLQPGNYAVLGSAKLVSFTPLETATAAQLEMVQKVWNGHRKGGTVFKFVLSSPLPVKPGDYLDLPGNNAPGFTIRDCVFSDHRARGLRIMANNGVIERNTFRRLKFCGISLGAEYAFWREAGWLENIVVQDNVIEDVGRDGSQLLRETYSTGAINVFVRCDKKVKDVWPGHRDIVIRNNTIRDCPSAGVRVVAASNVRVEKNTMSNILYKPGAATKPIEILHSRQVEVKDNTVQDLGEEPVRQ